MKGGRKINISLPVLLLCAGGLVALAGCSLDTPTDMAQKRVELVHNRYSQTYLTDQMDEAQMRAAADHYQHYGDGPVELIVTYNPQSRTNTAMKAASEAERMATDLRRAGVPDVEASILPVATGEDFSSSLIAYETVTAQAPEGCEAMGGLDGRQTESNSDYQFGCSVEMQVARQIARPRDLAGRPGLDAADGRRQSNVVEPYKTGTPNEPIEGETSTASPGG